MGGDSWEGTSGWAGGKATLRFLDTTKGPGMLDSEAHDSCLQIGKWRRVWVCSLSPWKAELHQS